MLSSVAVQVEGALLACEDLRVDDAGVPAVEGLSFRALGPRALVLGAPRALFAAAAGTRAVVRGTLTVAGVPADRAAREGLVVACPRDAKVPPTWTALEYLVWSARLAGHARRVARTRAESALERTLLGFATKQRIDRLPLAARRALEFGAALARGAGVVLLEDPLDGLPEETAEAHARIMMDALEPADGQLVVFAPRVRVTSTLMARASHVAVVDGNEALDGTPAIIAARASSYALRAEGSPEAVAALTAHVEARGGSLRPAGPSRLTLDLGPTLTTAELLAAAIDEDVLVVEIRPLGRALA